MPKILEDYATVERCVIDNTIDLAGEPHVDILGLIGALQAMHPLAVPVAHVTLSATTDADGDPVPPAVIEDARALAPARQPEGTDHFRNVDLHGGTMVRIRAPYTCAHCFAVTNAVRYHWPARPAEPDFVTAADDAAFCGSCGAHSRTGRDFGWWYAVNAGVPADDKPIEDWSLAPLPQVDRKYRLPMREHEMVGDSSPPTEEL